ncbi:arylsulfatase [Parabacteroides gordonii]|uniref:arylsulfatase n=1 Tax=Parabacteroides gordonii TaxID=574930 RepID=UPI000EBAE361|nr:arylsulfatase [Parabacteroides gordonii]RGP17523.1 DUF229 domain-containing protein [Parabacteroides gordonii]
MKTYSFIATLLVAPAYLSSVLGQEKQNIIFVLTDDQGYGDLRCNGNPYIHTPNIDNLERESISFADFHSATTSAPTRAGIMTGKYCNSTGVWHTINGRSLLTIDFPTLPELLSQAGYETGMFGKWHLGDNFPYRPHDRGFKEAFYHGGGGIGQTPDVWENNYYNDTYFRNGEKEKATGYCTDIWFNEALSFIDNNKEKPFFCYISTNAPHSPFNVERKYSDVYENNPDVPNPYFYGMISNIDENIGRLMSYLKDNKLLDNTIVVFMTDNGTASGVKFDNAGHVEKGYNAQMRGMKSSQYEGGHRVPFIMRTPKKKPQTIYSLASYIDIMPTFLDLCGLRELIPANIEGQSLLPLMEKDEDTDRFIFIDTQRLEYLEKGRLSCVMHKKWRLINGKELYNIIKDPSQKNDVSDKHPELVKKMNEQYESWWLKSSERADKFESIDVEDTKEPHVLLTSHDLHNDSSLYVAWNQDMIRAASNNIGYWALNIKKEGKYRISLYRWPPDTGLKLNEPAPSKRETWGKVSEHKAGMAIKDFASVEIFLNHKLVQTKKVNENKTCVEINMKLKEGPCFLQTDFIHKSGKRRSAYYVTIEYIH